MKQLTIGSVIGSFNKGNRKGKKSPSIKFTIVDMVTVTKTDETGHTFDITYAMDNRGNRYETTVYGPDRFVHTEKFEDEEFYEHYSLNAEEEYQFDYDFALSQAKLIILNQVIRIKSLEDKDMNLEEARELIKKLAVVVGDLGYGEWPQVV